MKKTTFLKTILLAAAMVVGESQAWAQTTLYYRTLTGTESDPADAAEQAWSASDIGTGKWETISGTPTVSVVESENVIGLKSLGVGTISNSSQISPSENVKLTIDCVWEFNGGNSADNNEYLQIGNNIRINALPKATSGNVTFNSADVRTITNACSNSGNRWNDTWTIHIEINTATNKVTALTISGAHETKPASYTYSGELALTGSPTFNTITMGQNNRSDSYVLLKSIKITETPQYAYSVHWKSGDTDMGEFTAGYDVDGASVSIPYYRYLSTNHELYKISTGNGTDVPTVSFTKTTDNQTEYMTGYTKQDAGYVVFCEEAETIEGMTIASPYTPNRCSGGKAAYCSDDVTITSLPAGTYKVCIGMYGNASNQTFIVKAGETEVLNHEFTKSSTRGEATSDPFTINTTTDIKIKGGVSGTAFDNIYIVCTSGRVASVDNLGYTFSSTLPLDFTGTTVEAYTAAYNSTTKKVDLNRVYKVPANTGLFIKGTAADIPVLTGDADAIGTNNLVAVSEATTVAVTDGSNTNYVLALADKDDTSKGVLFLKAADTTVGAGKAYLQIPTASAPAPQLMLSFGDVIATGINMVQGDGFKVNGYYDLQGRKVMNPKKGLYIVNGKKVVIK